MMTHAPDPLAVPLVLLRYAVLEHGRRLVARGRLAGVDDVFFLTLPEVRSALAGSTADLVVLVERRRGERAWAEQHPGPPSYGTHPGRHRPSRRCHRRPAS